MHWTQFMLNNYFHIQLFQAIVPNKYQQIKLVILIYKNCLLFQYFQILTTKKIKNFFLTRFCTKKFSFNSNIFSTGSDK